MTKNLSENEERDMYAGAIHAALVEFVSACAAEPAELRAAIEFFEQSNPAVGHARASTTPNPAVEELRVTDGVEERRMAAVEIHAVLLRHFAHYGDVPLELVRAAEFLNRQRVGTDAEAGEGKSGTLR